MRWEASGPAVGAGHRSGSPCLSVVQQLEQVQDQRDQGSPSQLLERQLRLGVD